MRRFHSLDFQLVAFTFQFCRVWDKALVAFTAKAQLDLRALPKRASDPLELLVAAALKQTTSVTNRWLADRLKLGSVNSVGPWLHRWRQVPASDK